MPASSGRLGDRGRDPPLSDADDLEIIARYGDESGASDRSDAVWALIQDVYRSRHAFRRSTICIRQGGDVVLDPPRSAMRAASCQGRRARSQPSALDELDAPIESLLSGQGGHRDGDAQVKAGSLRLDDEVAAHLPGFERHGKERITIRHILTHRSGARCRPRRSISTC